MVTVAPDADAATGMDEGSVTATLFSWTLDDVPVVDDDTTSDRVASVPLEIVLGFSPHTRHVTAPGTLLHESVLPALLEAGPTRTEAEEKSAVEYAAVH